MRCYHCDCELKWNSCVDVEDCVDEAPGVITFLTCTNEKCNAEYEIFSPIENT